MKSEDVKRFIYVSYRNADVWYIHPIHPRSPHDNVWLLKQEVRDWMNERSADVDRSMVRDDRGCWFYFTDEDLALLFKLTWGGQ